MKSHINSIICFNMLFMFVLFISICTSTVTASQLDCSYSSNSIYAPTACSTPNSDSYYCNSPYKCCSNNLGCCFNGDADEAYTVPEIVGLSLCCSALFVMAIMTLVICGATFCSDNDDTSPLFTGGK